MGEVWNGNYDAYHGKTEERGCRGFKYDGNKKLGMQRPEIVGNGGRL
jgi:hypothetical protein